MAGPLYDPAPDPFQEPKTYRVPASTETGVIAPKVAMVPASYHPVLVGEP